MKPHPYRVETGFGGKWHWLDSFETLADALHVALRKRCNWRIRKDGVSGGMSIGA